MAKYDVEKLVSDVTAYLKANLAAKLTEISNEKADGVVLAAIDPAAYFVQTMSEKVANYNPYIFIGIVDPITSDSTQFASALGVTVEVALVIADGGTDVNLWQKMYRYQRAMREIFELGWNVNNIGTRLSVQGYILPVPPEMRMQQVGVKLEAHIS